MELPAWVEFIVLVDMAELVAVLRFEQVEVVVEGIWSPFLLVKPPEQGFVVRIDRERVARCE